MLINLDFSRLKATGKVEDVSIKSDTKLHSGTEGSNRCQLVEMQTF